MSKYSIEDKKKYIKLIESGKHSIRSAAKEIGVSKSVGERWLKTYKALGIEALIKKPRNHYTKYCSEFKLYAIEYKKDNHLSFNQASADLGVAIATLTRWEQIYLEEGEEGLSVSANRRPYKTMKNRESKINSSKGKEELIEENERLRAEIDYLKKCIALTQEKGKPQTKKKQK